MESRQHPKIELSTLAHIDETLTTAELRTAYLATTQDSEHRTIAIAAQLATLPDRKNPLCGGA
ncbi:MAG: hypothetical protein ABSH56_35650 [Bryobacteraceae bacterium]|jgi:hypothetical protein